MDLTSWFSKRENVEKTLKTSAVLIIALGFLAERLSGQRWILTVAVILGVLLWGLGRKK